MITPSRQRGFEYLDDPTLAPVVAEHSLRDIALANRLFGGTKAVLAEMRSVFDELHTEKLDRFSLLDVGTGLGDIPNAIQREAKSQSLSVNVTGIEISESMARHARKRTPHIVAADARELPFASNSVDVITCSQVLHHLSDDKANELLLECSRVARRRVIIADLRRSWLAMGLLWAVSYPLGFHPVSRHDGVTSIRRGFTKGELANVIRASGNNHVKTSDRLGWRVTAAWTPGRIPL
ncbi:MAG: methyltransferase domain-containing protein, partial [Gemmatimonadaceae bacterium]